MALSQVARAFGLPVSKGVSFGNGTVLDCTDFLEYLGQDKETEIIGMYLEGVRNGRKFFEALRMAAQLVIEQ
jgi:acyl-CoA synthetase (NDP forming)